MVGDWLESGRTFEVGLERRDVMILRGEIDFEGGIITCWSEKFVLLVIEEVVCRISTSGTIEVLWCSDFFKTTTFKVDSSTCVAPNACFVSLNF